MGVTPTSGSSLVVTMQLSKPGTAFCYVTTDLVAPLGWFVKARTTCYKSADYTNSAFNVSCSSLTPFATYKVYCYTEDLSVPANKLPDSSVAASVRTVREQSKGYRFSHLKAVVVFNSQMRLSLRSTHYNNGSSTDPIPLLWFLSVCLSTTTTTTTTIIIIIIIIGIAQVTMPCCYTMVTPTMPTVLFSKAVSPSLSIKAPVTGATVVLSSEYVPAIQDPTNCTAAYLSKLSTSAFNSSVAIRFSPSNRLSMALITEAKFTVSGKTGGCYRINYNITGKWTQSEREFLWEHGTTHGHDDHVRCVPILGAMTSRFNPVKSDTLFVLGAGAMPPTPVVSKAKFSDTGAQIFVTFDSATDRGGSIGVFLCSFLFSFTGASSSFCSWTSPTVVTITLGTGATILPNDPITLLASKVG